MRDDDEVFAIVRTSATGQNRSDGFALLAVGGRVLTLSFTGFEREHLPELRALVADATRDVLARNGPAAASVIGANPQ